MYEAKRKLRFFKTDSRFIKPKLPQPILFSYKSGIAFEFIPEVIMTKVNEGVYYSLHKSPMTMYELPVRSILIAYCTWSLGFVKL